MPGFRLREGAAGPESLACRIFNRFVLRSPVNGNKELRELISAIHRHAAYSLLIVALGHAALALFHFYVLRDQVLARNVTAQRSVGSSELDHNSS
jgi:cytochrome b561